MCEYSDRDFTCVEPWRMERGPTPRGSRRLVRAVLAGQPPDLVDQVVLGVTELVTNAYRHGLRLPDDAIPNADASRGSVVLRVARIRRGPAHHLRIEVYDPNPVPPDWTRGPDDGWAVHGRGLALMRGQLSRYGAISTRNGKVVVVEYELHRPLS
ncbi:hypothetical protein GWI34_03315 [Actinomadura sp. DSM 109109]|nr:hypothetical protein [Actinomadura lepetitiana]